MPASTATPYGKVIKGYRKRLNISQVELATITNEDVSRIIDLEAGNAPSLDPAFYPRLLQGTGSIEIYVSSVLQVAEADESTEELEKLIDHLIEPLLAHPKVAEIFRWHIAAAEEEAQDSHLRFPNVAAGKYGKIPSRTAAIKVKSGEHLTQYTPNPEKQVDPREVQGTNTPEFGLQQPSTETEQRQQAPKKGEVYKRPRSHYYSDYLRENARHITSILGDALENDDPALSPDRKQALHVVVESIVKKKGASLNKVSREKHIPHPSLWEWVAKGLIPVLYRDKRTIYLANEIAEEVSHDYQDAKEMNYSAARLLRERRDKYFPEEAAQPRT